MSDTPNPRDWLFHQATGMVAAQIDSDDMATAAARLIATADEIGESVHDTARLVLDRRLRLSPGGSSRYSTADGDG
jgi:hypothetical protein